ncbi:hypothetical protein G7Z17_g5258 [Cylindrodendrum hubeiense]|uniref:O-methyltransferase C-terminal domain-containing protein n=1 Tax=Cylindrodendrum hubeiense TaxID=595255 RepID=A0A9P5H9A2_9HYPO|nr:hypothetical protein G7Z17_g5258 [Cylindrodendrum hubeiense]
MSVNKGQLLTLSGRLTAAINTLPTLNHREGGVANRRAIIALAQEILHKATLPEEEWLGDVALLCTMTASRLFLKWGAFDGIPTKGAVAYDSLAEKLKVDASLFRRVGAMLVASKVLRQLGDDHLAHTPRSLIYANSAPHSFLARMFFDETLKSCVFMPDYFDKYHEEPNGPVGCPYTFAEGNSDKSVWEIMDDDPERMRVFMEAMNTVESQMPATGMYDFGWVKGEVAKKTKRMLFVDVGALIYHLRRCLHDYGDEIGINILRHISGAMAPDSRLLIVEQVVDVLPSPMDTHFDFVMMTIGGKERNAKQFEKMAKEAGLRILEIHKKSDTPISVIECAKE